MVRQTMLKCWCQCQPRACQDVCHVFRSEAPPGTREDAEVRAPLPVVRDRLYGVDLAGLSRPRGAPQRERNQVDAFRDFRCAAAVASKRQCSMPASRLPLYPSTASALCMINATRSATASYCRLCMGQVPHDSSAKQSDAELLLQGAEAPDCFHIGSDIG